MEWLIEYSWIGGFGVSAILAFFGVKAAQIVMRKDVETNRRELDRISITLRDLQAVVAEIRIEIEAKKRAEK